MSSPQPARPPHTSLVEAPHSQPHIVSLVLQSKKALQMGEQFCSHAHNVSHATGRAALDVLALDAKVRWISDTVFGQLKLATAVAKGMQEKRSQLETHVKVWDLARAKHTDVLESVLESLGAQLVPPEFHQSSADSSLFGSQHSADGQDAEESNSAEIHKPSPLTANPSTSPSSTLRRTSFSRTVESRQKTREDAGSDRKRWKTLRDFVDDQAIEDVLEVMDNERAALDDTIAMTDEYHETLQHAIESIQSSVPVPSSISPSDSKLLNGSVPRPKFNAANATALVEDTLTSQDKLVTSMASHLESLAAHYDQMSTILRDSEAGEAFSEEDLQDMKRDTDELPAIIAELEENTGAVQACHDKLLSLQNAREQDLARLSIILDDLDELGEVMDEMLRVQENIEAKCEEELSGLQRHLLTLDHLHARYIAYQVAFNKLVQEIARRSQYQEAVEKIVKRMLGDLNAMTEDETKVRTHFNAEYGAHLPEDICLCIGNAPTKWDIIPGSGEAHETLPYIAEDLIAEAQERLKINDGVAGTESL